MIRLVLMAACAAALVACARPVGDLGRVREGTADAIIVKAGISRDPAVGSDSPTGLIQSDEEREMHNRIWRFLEAPHARAWLHRTDLKITDYYDYLRAKPYGSSHIRYQTLISDIDIDLATLPDTFAAICTVIAFDDRREMALVSLSDADRETEKMVDLRRRQNAASIRRFTDALQLRFDAYSYALKMLLIETPYEQARHADEALSRMGIWVTSAGQGSYCIADLPPQSVAVSAQPVPGRRSGGPRTGASAQ